MNFFSRLKRKNDRQEVRHWKMIMWKSSDIADLFILEFSHAVSATGWKCLEWSRTSESCRIPTLRITRASKGCWSSRGVSHVVLASRWMLLTNHIQSIVGVHGLNGHREKTWTSKDDVNWLKDLLPKTIPNARIFSWGYDANTHSKSHVTVQYLYDHATTLVSDLSLERRLTEVWECIWSFSLHH
jgi:hypothetical protein